MYIDNQCSSYMMTKW